VKAALLILGLALLCLLTVKGLAWTGQIAGPLFQAAFTGQVAVGF